MGLLLMKNELPVKWGWLLVTGILLALIGMAGLIFSQYLTLASVTLFGGLSIAAGVLKLWHLFKLKELQWSARSLHGLIALMYILMGGLFLLNPFGGAISLTLVLTSFMLVTGLLRLYFTWKYFKNGWRWVYGLVGALLNFVLAGLIIYGWPTSAFWVIGTFVAIEILFSGSSLIGVALLVRKLQKN